MVRVMIASPARTHSRELGVFGYDCFLLHQGSPMKRVQGSRI